MSGFFVLLLNGGDTVIHAVMLCGNFILLAFDDFVAAFLFAYPLECVSKISEYAISGGAPPFLRHKARLSAAKLSDFFLELT